jgi:ribosomal protein L34E
MTAQTPTRRSSNSYACQECGMRVESAREYHPYEFCVLYKAGQNPSRFYAEIRKRVLDESPREEPTHD